MKAIAKLLSAIFEYYGKKKCTEISYRSDLFCDYMEDIMMYSHTRVSCQNELAIQHNQPRKITLFCKTGIILWMTELLPIEAASLFGWKMNP